MEISWTDRVRNEQVLRRMKEEKNVLRTITRRKTTWIGHILRLDDCLLKRVIEGKMGREDKEEDVSGYWIT
jgi:hypothetical protein